MSDCDIWYVQKSQNLKLSRVFFKLSSQAVMFQVVLLLDHIYMHPYVHRRLFIYVKGIHV